MAEFVVVTRKDNGAHQIINLDAIERIDINPPVPLPPLDSNEAITSAHLGGSVIHFIFAERGPTRLGLDSVTVLETADDILELSGSDKAMTVTQKLADARAKKIEQIKADREKQRQQNVAAQSKAEQAAAQDQLKAARDAEKQAQKAARKSAPRAKSSKAKAKTKSSKAEA